MVVAAIAQSIAFSYQPFVNITSGKSNVLQSIGHVLTVNDVFMDAHNTFIGDPSIDQSDRDVLEETQMDLIMKNDQAFNWQDDDEKQISAIKSRSRESGAVPNFKSNHKKENKNSDPEDLLIKNNK